LWHREQPLASAAAALRLDREDGEQAEAPRLREQRCEARAARIERVDRADDAQADHARITQRPDHRARRRRWRRRIDDEESPMTPSNVMTPRERGR